MSQPIKLSGPLSELGSVAPKSSFFSISLHSLRPSCASGGHGEIGFWVKEGNLRVERRLLGGSVKRGGDLDLRVAVAGVFQRAKAHGSGYEDDGEDNLRDETLPVPAGVVEPLDEDGHDLLQQQAEAMQPLSSGQDFV